MTCQQCPMSAYVGLVINNYVREFVIVLINFKTSKSLIFYVKGLCANLPKETKKRFFNPHQNHNSK